MSTRCNVIVRTPKEGRIYYRHHDGYPSETGANLAELLLEFFYTDSGDSLSGLRLEDYGWYSRESEISEDIEYLYLIREENGYCCLYCIDVYQYSEEHLGYDPEGPVWPGWPPITHWPVSKMFKELCRPEYLLYPPIKLYRSAGQKPADSSKPEKTAGKSSGSAPKKKPVKKTAPKTEYRVVDDSGLLGTFTSKARAAEYVKMKRAEGKFPRIAVKSVSGKVAAGSARKAPVKPKTAKGSAARTKAKKSVKKAPAKKAGRRRHGKT